MKKLPNSTIKAFLTVSGDKFKERIFHVIENLGGYLFAIEEIIDYCEKEMKMEVTWIQAAELLSNIIQGSKFELPKE